MDLGCYLLNMACYFSGSAPLVRRAEALVGPPYIDVAMEAALEFEDGANATITCSISPESAASAWFRVIGEQGDMLIINPFAPHRGHSIIVRNRAGEQHEFLPGRATYVHQLEAFVAAVRGEKPFATSGREGVLNMRLIDQIYCAAGLPCRGMLDGLPPVGSLKKLR